MYHVCFGTCAVRSGTVFDGVMMRPRLDFDLDSTDRRRRAYYYTGCVYYLYENLNPFLTTRKSWSTDRRKLMYTFAKRLGRSRTDSTADHVGIYF